MPLLSTLRADPTTAEPGAFQAWDRFVESWYPVMRGRSLPQGKIRVVDFLGKAIVLYRTTSGVVGAEPANCPHLGAPLAAGCVSDSGIRCAMHGWEFKAAAGLPVRERHGILWVHHGPSPRFEIPDVKTEGRSWVVLPLPAVRLQCHPHAATGNGFDAGHFDHFHGMDVLDAPRLTSGGPGVLTAALHGRPRSTSMRRMLGLGEGAVRSTFSSYGGNLSLTHIIEPFEARFLLAGQPLVKERACLNFGVIALPRHPLAALRALLFTRFLLRGDERLLNGMVLAEGFTPADASIKAFVSYVKALPHR